MGAYDDYIQNADRDNRRYDEKYPVTIREFFKTEYQLSFANRPDNLTWPKEPVVIPEGTFAYGGYHFMPYRSFCKGEISRRLKGDSRQWKTDAHYAMRNMRSDFGMGLSKYDWQKAEYSHCSFYAAAGHSTCDIFRCVENEKLYVPGENELFQYTEPL